MLPTIVPVNFFLLIFFISNNCNNIASGESIHSTQNKPSDSPLIKLILPEEKPANTYDSLIFQSVKTIQSSSGTKSVVFSKNMRFLYAMNLEGMSVMEFSQSTKEITRIFKFKQTPGTGWDYDTDSPIPSFEEKPVEAHLSNNDSILWVSLHNAEGIVPIHLFGDIAVGRKTGQQSDKLIYLQDPRGNTIDSFYVPLIKTGKTPKVISCTSDDRYLLVSNWHSYNVSVLAINAYQYPYATRITDIKVPHIPRGIVIDETNNKSYVAIMGGSSLSVIDNKNWTYEREMPVDTNPRHILQDRKSRLFVSYNRTAKIGCVDPSTGQTLFSVSTAAQPRSMILSNDQSYLFVTCYSANKLMIFKIFDDHFQLMSELDCEGHPVGVDVYEEVDRTEIWVCSYSTGTISVYDFLKK